MLSNSLLDALATLNDHDPETCPICSQFNKGGRESLLNDLRSVFPQYDPPEPPKPKPMDPLPPEPEPEPEPRPKNREREAAFRMVMSVEKALKKLPSSSAGRIAGYLQGLGWAGDLTAKGNVLALYLRNGKFAYWTEGSLYNAMERVNVLVEPNGIIVENEEYQIAISPPSWLESFMTMLRDKEFPELLA